LLRLAGAPAAPAEEGAGTGAAGGDGIEDMDVDALVRMALAGDTRAEGS
jgi:hypothetical protein